MKLVAFILSFLILSSAVIPCNVFDNCEEQEQASQCHDSEEEEGDCEDCSPFSVCSGETGLTIPHDSHVYTPRALDFAVRYFDLHMDVQSDYYSDLFQPPRHAC